MPGPPPNPNSARSKKRGLTVLAAGQGRDVPAPPPGMLKATNEAWMAFWQSPLTENVIDTDHMALRRLFGLYDRRERFDREGIENPVVAGSTGQETLNALLKEVDVLDAKILALEDRFGMSPMARLKLQVQLGDADRADRSIAETRAARERETRAEAPDPRRIAK